MRRLSFLRVMGMVGVVTAAGSAFAAQPVAPVGVPAYNGAQTPTTQLFNTEAHAPEINSVPALTNLVKSGAKLYYLGERSGMHGWFIMQDGQIQMLYLAPDRKSVVVGAMFSSEGENVTTPQIAALAQSNKDVNELLNGSAKDQKDVAMAGVEGGAASVPGNKDGAGQKVSNGLPSSPLSPGERLMQDLKASASVSLGKAEAPELIMVVAPSCPNCKRTWGELRDAVKAGKMQVRLVPVYNSSGTEEKRVAAQMLRAQDPLTAWDSFVGGNTDVFNGTPDDAALRAVQSNLSLVAKWNIQGYPYLAYRGQDGRIKIVQGKPERMAAVLSDLGR